MSSYLLSVAKERWQHDRTQTWINVFNLIGSHGGCDMVKNKRIEPWMSEAFLIWIRYLGYRIVTKGFCTEFIPTYTSKNLPRGASIDHLGRLNKQASKLFIEFKGHLEVA